MDRKERERAREIIGKRDRHIRRRQRREAERQTE